MIDLLFKHLDEGRRQGRKPIKLRKVLKLYVNTVDIDTSGSR